MTASITRLHQRPLQLSKLRQSAKSMPPEYSTIRNTSRMLHETLSKEWCCTDDAHEGHYAGLLMNAKVKTGIRLDLAISGRMTNQSATTA
jgi:hypothetical protein